MSCVQVLTMCIKPNCWNTHTPRCCHYYNTITLCRSTGLVHTLSWLRLISTSLISVGTLLTSRRRSSYFFSVSSASCVLRMTTLMVFSLPGGEGERKGQNCKRQSSEACPFALWHGLRLPLLALTGVIYLSLENHTDSVDLYAYMSLHVKICHWHIHTCNYAYVVYYSAKTMCKPRYNILYV